MVSKMGFNNTNRVSKIGFNNYKQGDHKNKVYNKLMLIRNVQGYLKFRVSPFNTLITLFPCRHPAYLVYLSQQQFLRQSQTVPQTGLFPFPVSANIYRLVQGSYGNTQVMIEQLGDKQVNIEQLGNTQVMLGQLGDKQVILEQLGDILVNLEQLGDKQILFEQLGNKQVN